MSSSSESEFCGDFLLFMSSFNPIGTCDLRGFEIIRNIFCGYKVISIAFEKVLL